MAIGGFGKGALAGLAQWGVGRLTPQQQGRPATQGSQLAEANSFLNILVKLRQDERAREQLASTLKTQKLTRQKSRQSIKTAEEKATREEAERRQKAADRLGKELRAAEREKERLRQLQENLGPESIFWGKQAKPVDPYSPVLDADTAGTMPLKSKMPELDILAGAMMPTKTTGTAAYTAPIGPIKPSETAEQYATKVPGGKWRKTLGAGLSDALLAQGRISPKAAVKEMNTLLKKVEQERRSTEAGRVKAEENMQRKIKELEETAEFKIANAVEKQKMIEQVRLEFFKKRGGIKQEQSILNILSGTKPLPKGWTLKLKSGWAAGAAADKGIPGLPGLPGPVPGPEDYELVYTGKADAGKKKGWAALTQNQQLSRKQEARELAAFIEAYNSTVTPTKTTVEVFGDTTTPAEVEAKRARLNDLYEAFPELKAMFGKKGKKGKKGKGAARQAGARLP